jgi:hypothetical protein
MMRVRIRSVLLAAAGLLVVCYLAGGQQKSGGGRTSIVKRNEAMISRKQIDTPTTVSFTPLHCWAL